MSTKLKIKVTKDILEKSKNCGVSSACNVPANCAISLAMRDLFPHARVYGGGQIAFMGEKIYNINYNSVLPTKAFEFMRHFDQLVDYPQMRPNLLELEFEVEIPDSVIEQINIEELKPLLINHPTLQLV